jgi:hypothetical protein
MRRSNQDRHATQVITQIELAPLCGPQSPVDLVPSEIVFGHMFEAFCWMSQAKIDASTAPVGGDIHPLKRTRRAPLVKKILANRYFFCFLHSDLNIA